MVPLLPTAAMHTKVAGVGYGGTLNFESLVLGVSGQRRAHGMFTWTERVHCNTHCEQKAVCLLLMGVFGLYAVRRRCQRLLL